MPGIWSRDTLFSHGNSSTVPWHQSDGPPDWIVAPGMQGVDVQPFTANMLTPDSLAELMARLEGPVVQELNVVFATDWFTETGEDLREVVGAARHRPGVEVGRAARPGPHVERGRGEGTLRGTESTQR